MSELNTHRKVPPRHSRRFYLRPAPILYAVLLAEVFLLVSDQFRWFVFNVHKGWAVLICLATIALVMLLLSLWFVANGCYQTARSKCNRQLVSFVFFGVR